MNKLKHFLFVVIGTVINTIGADIVIESTCSAQGATSDPSVTDFASVGYVNKSVQNLETGVVKKADATTYLLGAGGTNTGVLSNRLKEYLTGGNTGVLSNYLSNYLYDYLRVSGIYILSMDDYLRKEGVGIYLTGSYGAEGALDNEGFGIYLTGHYDGRTGILTAYFNKFAKQSWVDYNYVSTGTFNTYKNTVASTYVPNTTFIDFETGVVKKEGFGIYLTGGYYGAESALDNEGFGRYLTGFGDSRTGILTAYFDKFAKQSWVSDNYVSQSTFGSFQNTVANNYVTYAGLEGATGMVKSWVSDNYVSNSALDDFETGVVTKADASSYLLGSYGTGAGAVSNRLKEYLTGGNTGVLNTWIYPYMMDTSTGLVSTYLSSNDYIPAFAVDDIISDRLNHFSAGNGVEVYSNSYTNASGRTVRSLGISGVTATKDLIGVAPLGRIPTAQPNGTPGVGQAFIWVE